MRRLVALLAVLILAACNSTTTSTTEAVSSTTAGPTTTSHSEHGTVPPFVEVEVGVATGPQGEQLVDAEGRSLYMFTLDDERTSTCEGACSELWPPFLGDPVAGDGVDPALFGNAERSDGSIQVTYGGHPLYFYAEDAAPGDAEGHGFNDVWFLVSPTGEPLSP
jgi:predicted lipoprotein with Yx(FWY)xxD motif